MTIGEGAFENCVSLEAVTLPHALGFLGDRAFYRCKSLTAITLPQGLKRIGQEAFVDLPITDLVIPQKMESIGFKAFFRCRSIEAVVIPPSVDLMENWVFHGCNRLKTIKITHTPTHLGEWITNKSTTWQCVAGSAVDAYCEDYGYRREYLTP